MIRIVLIFIIFMFVIMGSGCGEKSELESSITEPISTVPSATVTEPLDASGVKNVSLWYTNNTTVWSSVGMALHGGAWKATLAGQSEGVNVKFFVKAFDKIGNNARTPNFSYTTIIPNRSPIAVLMYSPSIVNTGVEVDFDASASYDPDGTIVSYSWDFGDGSTSPEAIVSHSYIEDGEYLVTLRIVDNKGLVGSKVAIQLVRNRSPVSAFTEIASILYKEETITFDASPSYDPDGTIVNYHWDLGDGTTATGVSVSHSYSENVAIKVTLTVTDNDGATDSTTSTANVINKSPVAILTESSETENLSHQINLSATESYDPDGTIVGYSWDFGDGTTATGVTVSHTYSQIGKYTVKLIVTDDDGATDSASTTKTVTNRAPVACFTESAEVVSTDDSIYFDASASYDPDGTIVGYSWDFGDGTTATGITVTHRYKENGVYTVTLRVIDDNVAIASSTAKKTVLNRWPVGTFTESDTIVIQNEIIYFYASESYDPDGTIVGYLWEFGDGNTTTGVTADHKYSEVGEYTVTLTVTDNDGYSTSVTGNIVVKTETTIPLALLSVIGLGITTLTATLLYGLFVRKKKKEKQKK